MPARRNKNLKTIFKMYQAITWKWPSLAGRPSRRVFHLSILEVRFKIEPETIRIWLVSKVQTSESLE